MHLLTGLGPCPLGVLRVCGQSGKNDDGSSYRVGSLSPRNPFGANEKGLKDEGLGFGFHVSAAPIAFKNTCENQYWQEEWYAPCEALNK